MQLFRSAFAGFLLATATATALTAQPAGVTPPEDVFIEVSRADGSISLSTDAVSLARGAYYRLNFVCLPEGGEPEFNFDVARLVRDSHLRVLTVENIEVYLQGLSFRAIQCEGPGSARFSFYPMRSGTYQIEITDEEDDSISASVTVSVD